jgi:hypothetical protein
VAKQLEDGGHSRQDLQAAAQRWRRSLTLGALILALVHVLWPSLAIDTVTLILLAVAIVPWLVPVFKPREPAAAPRVQYDDLQKAAGRAERAGLLEAPHPHRAEYAFQRVVEDDPNLALAGLRIEIERRLVKVAEQRGIDARPRGLGQLLRELTSQHVLAENERQVLADLNGLLDAAVHGAAVDERATYWAMQVGPRLLDALDNLQNRKR